MRSYLNGLLHSVLSIILHCNCLSFVLFDNLRQQYISSLYYTVYLQNNTEWNKIYNGTETFYNVTSLIPRTRYVFRLEASFMNNIIKYEDLPVFTLSGILIITTQLIVLT